MLLNSFLFIDNLIFRNKVLFIKVNIVNEYYYVLKLILLFN